MTRAKSPTGPIDSQGRDLPEGPVAVRLIRRLYGRARRAVMRLRAPAGGQVDVRVFHNVLPFFGYKSGEPVVQVFATTVNRDTPDLTVCDQMFELLNVGHDPDFTIEPDERAVRYRQRGNRSLSVGDLICVGGTWYSVESFGFAAVEPPKITTEGAPGSTSYQGVG